MNQYHHNPLPIFLSKVTVALVLVGALFRLLYKETSLLEQPVEFVRGLFWIMALVFLLSPVQNPWYLCWVVPFLCVFPHAFVDRLDRTGRLVLLGDFYFDYQETVSGLA